MTPAPLPIDRAASVEVEQSAEESRGAAPNGRLGGGLSLYWRVCVVNAGVLVIAAGLLAFTPVTVSSPIKAAQATYLLLGVIVMLLANLALIRTALRPLDQLVDEMATVDVLAPSGDAMVGGPPELRSLAVAYRQMMDRLERERVASGRRAMSIVEAEREHVSRELHDEIGQTLTAVLLLIRRAGEEAGALAPLDEAQVAVRSALDDLRRVADRLRPDTLEMLGLPAALASLAETFCDRAGLEAEVVLPDDYVSLSRESELAFYRIAQESLTNVVRHAHATRVIVALSQSEAGTRLQVIDDGCGIGAFEGNRPGGVRGMRERAGTVAAWFSIGAGVGGRGTAVTLTKPATP